MQLDPADFGEHDWKILKETIWRSRVVIDSSTVRRQRPVCIMAAREFGERSGSLELLWIHIIPLPSEAHAEALAVTLLERIRPNPQSEVKVVDQRVLDGIHVAGTSSVRVLEKTTLGMGMTGRVLNIVAVVNNVAYGAGYGCLGDGWTQDKFVRVAQLQADKINSQLVAV